LVKELELGIVLDVSLTSSAVDVSLELFVLLLENFNAAGQRIKDFMLLHDQRVTGFNVVR
jgi:hypothetical protein